MQSRPELSSFLRAARSRLQPEDAGIYPTVTRRARRVTGLRRDEVAGLAGISVDYYARLEQGRIGQISESVRRSVANALRMNETERAYLETLTAERPALAGTAPPTREPEALRAGVAQMLESLNDSPALVTGRGLSVAAANPLAEALFFTRETTTPASCNLARWIFLDPSARERYVRWDVVASGATGVLRRDAANSPGDRYTRDLIIELIDASTIFRRMWNEHRVFECSWGAVELFHPVTGRIDLHYEALDIPGTIGQKMLTYTAARGTTAREALNRLRAWTDRSAARGSGLWADADRPRARPLTGSRGGVGF